MGSSGLERTVDCIVLFSWIHLEGRNRETLLEVLKYLNEAKQTKFSVEVEKVGRGFEDFIPLADIVFVSKV